VHEIVVAPGNAAAEIETVATCASSASFICEPYIEERWARYQASIDPEERTRLIQETQGSNIDMAEKISYHLKGSVLGGCSCDWGCPCNFEAPPTRGFCEGEYIWCVEQGHYGDVRLAGLIFGMFFHCPAAVHLGHLTAVAIVDERANPPQRQAIEAMITNAVPFNLFLSLTSNFLGFRAAPFAVHLDGIRSRVTIPGIYELGLTPMTNPVTGEIELATLLKPTGFTSQQSELCATTVERFQIEGLSYNHSGKYGEFAPFEYTGA
jgi:hypothetical protein